MHGFVTVTDEPVDCGVPLRSRPTFGHVSNMNPPGKVLQYYLFVAGVMRINRTAVFAASATCGVSRVACDRSSEASEALS
jgi:hypothetical protein